MPISNSKFKYFIFFLAVFFSCCQNNHDYTLTADYIPLSLKGEALQNSKMYLVREGKIIDSALFHILDLLDNDSAFVFSFTSSDFIFPSDTIYNSSYPNIKFYSYRLKGVKSNGTPYILEYEINGIKRYGHDGFINMDQLIE